MAGEKSKLIGEYGEKIVYKLLEKFGWTPLEKNIDVDCIRPELHKRKLKKHGIDYIKHYPCPLQTDSQKTILISAKYYQRYPSSTKTSLVKQFITELGQALFCIKPNAEYGRKKLNKRIKDIQLRGLLFHLNHDEGFQDSLLNNIEQFRLPSYTNFEPIYLIDNQRATFFYSIFEHFKVTYPSHEIKFSYAETEYNLDTLRTIPYGRVLPLEYLVSDIIPIRVDISEDKKILALYHNGEFKKETFARLVSFCRSFTNGWNSKTIILFSTYQESKQRSEVDSVLSIFQDSVFASQLSVESFPLLDFRKLEED